MAVHNEDFSTTIGEDAVFKGQLRFEKGLRLLGKLEGEIDSKGQLVIGEGAMLAGDAKAGTIRVDGQVKGNLTAESKVQLSASAKLEGDLQTARLEVAEGAVLVGRCTIGVNGRQPSATQPVTKPVEAAAPAEKDKPQEARKR
jgi:cytoskeletal protein CcmA (bactofilin family)